MELKKILLAIEVCNLQESEMIRMFSKINICSDWKFGNSLFNSFKAFQTLIDGALNIFTYNWSITRFKMKMFCNMNTWSFWKFCNLSKTYELKDTRWRFDYFYSQAILIYKWENATQFSKYSKVFKSVRMNSCDNSKFDYFIKTLFLKTFIKQC